MQEAVFVIVPATKIEERQCSAHTRHARVCRRLAAPMFKCSNVLSQLEKCSNANTVGHRHTLDGPSAGRYTEMVHKQFCQASLRITTALFYLTWTVQTPVIELHHTEPSYNS